MLKAKYTKIMALAVTFALLISFVPVFSVPVSAAAPATYSSIAVNETKSITISTSGESKYFLFVPTVSGSYTYESSGSVDSYGYILDANGNTLFSDDDAGTDRNFKITCDLVAENTYYLKAAMWNSNTGSYTMSIICNEAVGEVPDDDVIQINQSNTTYSLFNSGRTTNSGYDADCNSTNPAPHTYDNGGYDLYGSIDDLPRFRLGLSFAVDADIVEQSVLSIRAWDVDESTRGCSYGYEYDYIYLVDETANSSVCLDTHLSGQNDTWNNSAITIYPDLFTTGHTYHFELQMTCTGNHNCGYYAVTVRTVNLTVNEVNNPDPIPNPDPEEGIENADLSASISANGTVSVSLIANAYAEDSYTLEYKAVCSSDATQRGGKEYSVTIPTESAAFDTTFQLESGSPRGTYEITVFIKDGLGNVVTTRSTNASYGYSAVSYNANGGSQNLPTDGTTYSSGDTVTVLFNYVPSLDGYTFLGWATDRNATVPEFIDGGNNTFVIGDTDVTLYAVWEEIPLVPNPPVANNTSVLVIMEHEPWGYSSVSSVMSTLNNSGKISSYDIVTVSTAETMSFNDYGMIYVTRAEMSYTSYDRLYDKLTAYVIAGGRLLYNACADDVTSGQQFCLIPGGASVLETGSYTGTIADYSHPIVTGEYSDNNPLTDSVIQGNWLSHSLIDKSTLPVGYNVIINGDDNQPVLAEYALGNGRVILTTMTWEFYYRSTATYSYKAQFV